MRKESVAEAIPTAKYLPSKLQLTERTVSPGITFGVATCVRVLFAGSNEYIRIRCVSVASSIPTANYFPSGLQLTENTESSGETSGVATRASTKSNLSN